MYIDTYLLSKTLKLLELYYHIKWNTIIKLNVLPIEIVNIAIQDLSRLLEIETNLYQNEDYKNIFWGIYTKYKYNLYSKEKVESNLRISEICTILEEKFRDVNFLNQTNDVDRIIKLFDVLNRIDNQITNHGYLSSIIKISFEHIIDNENKDNEFIKLFFDKMKNRGYQNILFAKEMRLVRTYY